MSYNVQIKTALKHTLNN